jgi:oligosaccharide repeat unit polymerase
MNVMAAVAIASVGVLALLFGRSVLFPPVIFAAVWAGAFLILALSGHALYPIHDATRLVYVLGVLAFALGSLTVQGLLAPLPTVRYRPEAVLAPRRLAWVLDGFILLLVLGFPFYWRELQEAMRLTAASTLLQAARWRDVEAQAGLVPQVPRILGNIVQLSIPVTLLALAMAQRSLRWRLRVSALFGLALLYQVMTGGRAGVAALVFGGVAVAWIGAGRLRLSRVLPALVLFLLIFELIAIQLEKGFIRRGLTLQQNLPALVQDLRAYLVGGVVGFDRVVEHPGEIPSTGGLLRTVKVIANRLGAHYDLPSLHAQYSTLGDDVIGNVYTAYFLYLPDFGLLETLFLVAVAGGACTLAYYWAQRGSPAGRVFFALLFVGILQSAFIEGFYSNVNILLKAAVLLTVLSVICRPGVGSPVEAGV